MDATDLPGLRKQGWLVPLNGPQAGVRLLVREPVFRIGRHPDNDLVPSGDGAGTVSNHHLQITREDATFIIADLQSTNGTFVNGLQISRGILDPEAEILLGREGPGYRFLLDEPLPAAADKTLLCAVPAPEPEKEHPPDRHEALLREAVDKARRARHTGEGGQTMRIMHEMLTTAIQHSRKRMKTIVAVLVTALAIATLTSLVLATRLREEKSELDARIAAIEEELLALDDPVKVDALIQELSEIQHQAEDIQKNLLYKIGARDEEQDFVEAELTALLAEFGDEAYSIPPEFASRVRFYIDQYRNRDRELFLLALVDKRGDLEQMRSLLDAHHLPPDLAYMVLVETGFRYDSRSYAGAAGPWQFRARTARAYGLTVKKDNDERYDITKSTQAAARYIRHLILEFGSGGSVMLALAAYNLGPSRVKQAIRSVENPIHQRDFWYLYRTRALPPETREYVPKIMASIIIGRYPQRFGFE